MSNRAESGERTLSPGTEPKLRRNRKCREEAYKKLLSAIVDKVFLPRERLIASRLAKQLEMSRTPIREALQQLEVQGYVSATHGGGMIVKNYSPKEVQELYELRTALECGAIELVCQRITDQQLAAAQRCHDEMSEAAYTGDFDRFFELNATFHSDLLYAATGNERLCMTIRSLRDQFLEKRLARASIADDWETKMEQHAEILEAVRKRDQSLARKAVRQHLTTALEVQQRWLRYA